jgi:hypothetical protein
MKFKIFFIFVLFTFINNIYANTTLHIAVTQPISLDEIDGFKKYPLEVQQLISKAAILSKKNLNYLYGSSDPKNGGMDCSGTIYYLLNNDKLNNLPREADEFYRWVWEKGKFYSVVSTSFHSFEFSKLHPGDLLFWTGTYDVKRDPPISHVMIYLGKNKQGKPLMFGASDGRTYENKQMWGVSVFDFTLPNPQSVSRFIGYSCIPELTCH